jgi:hypothetical protein
MVTPAVMLTTGGLLVNGMLSVQLSITDRMREMTRARVELLGGPGGQVLDRAGLSPIGRERLDEIDVQLPVLLRRHHLNQNAILVIYGSIWTLGLSIVALAVAVGLDSETFGRVALGLVLAGTVVMLSGLAVAARSLARSAEAVSYAVERVRSLG